MAASISDIRQLLRVNILPKALNARRVFITGGTGYLGSNLIPVLIERGHKVRALIRPGSQGKLPAECEVVSGNALDANTYRHLIRPCDTFIHLVGAPRTSSKKVAEFREVDLVSGLEAIGAAAELAIPHFIYLSAAHSAPTTQSYIDVRSECEQMIQDRHLNATILRPGIVVGPEHHWRSALLPFYKALEWLPVTRSRALRLGLVTLLDMVLALAQAVESPVHGTRVMGVPEIRAAKLTLNGDRSRQPA